MEDRIRAYEKYIKRAAGNPTPELLNYHQNVVQNFQHERLIHLLIMLFFIAFSVFMLLLLTWMFINVSEITVIIPMGIATAIMVTLSIFYVKHYYFLENHIQALYNYTEKIYFALEDKSASKVMEKVADTIRKMF